MVKTQIESKVNRPSINRADKPSRINTNASYKLTFLGNRTVSSEESNCSSYTLDGMRKLNDGIRKDRTLSDRSYVLENVKHAVTVHFSLANGQCDT